MSPQPVIVLVEDDPVIQFLMAEALVDEGYDVIACSSGAQAMAVLRDVVPSLLLSDLHMEAPDSGLRVLHHLRVVERTRHTPAIIYSADPISLQRHASTFEISNAVTFGKPFDLALLLDTVADLMGPRSA